MIVAFFSDLETEIIPDEIIILGIPAGILSNLLSGNIAGSVTGCALGYSLLFLIAKLGKIIFKKEALGYGDLKLAALMGAWLAWDKLLLALLLGYIFGAVWAAILLALKRKKMGDYIPVGPARCAGALTVFFFGREIINLYLSVFF